MVRMRGLSSKHLAVAGIVGLVGLLGACAGQNGGSEPTPSPSAPPGWVDRSVISQQGGVIVEKVSYRSSGYKIWAEICRPDDSAAHAVALWNHGGFAGLFEGDRQACQQLAKGGFVVAASYYRGEGGSEGSVEACKGEVDDVAAMLTILKRETFVNAGKIVAVGASHGGCVTLSLAIRQPELKAAVDLAGPSDWAALHNWMSDQLARGEPFCASIGQTGCSALHQEMLGQLTAALGGTPSQVPQAYADRSPINRVGELRVPTLIIHGANDVIVNLDQTCLMRSALAQAGRAPASWYIDRSLREKASGSSCGGGFRSTPVLLAALETNALVIYEGQGHEMSGAVQDHVIALVSAFALAHL
jgi:dienelactone hydrolase